MYFFYKKTKDRCSDFNQQRLSLTEGGLPVAKPFTEKQKLQHYLHKRQVKTVVGNQANWGPNINIALMPIGMHVYRLSIMSSFSRSFRLVNNMQIIAFLLSLQFKEVIRRGEERLFEKGACLIFLA